MNDALSRTSSLLRWRSHLVHDLGGDVLEIGVGKGENLAFYRKANRVWAIEPDLARAAHARRTALRSHLPTHVDVAPVEALPYRTNSFDHVVSSLVFCSVSDQRQALAEIRRVLRPGGVLHMVEHVRPEQPWLAHLFARITPWWRQIAYNCHLDRPTLDVLGEEGWEANVHQRFLVFVHVTAR
jgi:ubiquinone/menaquinone biosynthesis C-methylase UbiE